MQRHPYPALLQGRLATLRAIGYRQTADILAAADAAGTLADKARDVLATIGHAPWGRLRAESAIAILNALIADVADPPFADRCECGGLTTAHHGACPHAVGGATP